MFTKGCFNHPFILIILIFCVMMSLASHASQSQYNISWKKTNGPYGAQASVVNGPRGTSILFAAYKQDGQYGGYQSIRLYKTTDAGDHWSDISAGILSQYPSNETISITSISAVDENVAFLVVDIDDPFQSYSELLKTVDGGLHWSKIKTDDDTWIESISVVDENTLYLSYGYDALYKTTDGGVHWSCIHHGREHDYNDQRVGYIYAADALTIYAWMDGGFSKSNDGGQSWKIMNVQYEGLESYKLYDLIVIDANNLYALSFIRNEDGSTRDICNVSTDGGEHWQLVNLPSEISDNSPYFDDFYISASDPNAVYLYTYSGSVYKSIDKGQSWVLLQQKLSILKGASLFSLAANSLYASTAEGIYKYTDDNPQFIAAYNGISIMNIRAVWAINDNTAYALGGDYYGYRDRLYVTKDRGISWQIIKRFEPYLDGMYERRVTVYKNTLYVADDKTLYTYEGDEWHVLKTFDSTITFVRSSKDYLYVVSDAPIIYRYSESYDAVKDHMKLLSSEVVLALPPHVYRMDSFTVEDSYNESMTIVSEGRLYKRNYGPWEESILGQPFDEIKSLDGFLYALSNGAPYRSTDSGKSWQLMNNGLNGAYVYNIYHTYGRVLYTATSKGIFTSTDSGVSWTPLPYGGEGQCIRSIAKSPSSGMLYVGTCNDGVAIRG